MSELPTAGAVQATLLVDLLRHRAEERGGTVGYTLLDDGGESGWTYVELERRARAVAAQLQQEGAAGEPVLLLYPQGLDFLAGFFGCLAAGAIAVPAPLPRAQWHLTRITGIVQDCRPRLVLTSSAALGRIGSWLAQTSGLGHLRSVATDALDPAQAEEWQVPDSSPESVALLQYTSGSTASPKGVVVTHGNLVHNEEMIRQAFAQSEHSVVVSWLPLYHDMGLIGGVLQPLYLGARCILLSPLSFLRRPAVWLEAISRFRATTSGGPDFAYDLCARKVSPAEKEGLDLSSWSLAFNGSEPVRSATLERFAWEFAPCGFRAEAFYPCYGLAEATLLVAGGRASTPYTTRAFDAAALARNEAVPATPDAAARTLVSCGGSWGGQRILIVDPETCRSCLEGRIGEIWVTGPSVAAGYWGQPVLTADTFQATLAGGGADRFLRTGDLGFLHAGELFVAGRLKELIILRGRNLYPQDIEQTAASSHPALRPDGGAAFTIENAGEERLVVVQEVEKRVRFEPAEVAAVIRSAVAQEHEVRVHEVVLVPAGTIPKTSSGKTRRMACRDLLCTGALAILERDLLPEPLDDAEFLSVNREGASELEAALRGMAARFLRLPPGRIDPALPLVAYGLDSLDGIQLRNEIEATWGVPLSLRQLLGELSLAEIAGELQEQTSLMAAAERAPAEGAAITPGQRALWFLHQLAPEQAAYNIGGAARVTGALDEATLRWALQAIVDRHAPLRTSFSAPLGEPIPQIHDRAEVELESEDASGWSEALLVQRCAEVIRRPFDLGQAPLLRLALFRCSAGEHIAVLCLHHLVADFWSIGVLLCEVELLYAACRRGDGRPEEALAPLGLTWPELVRRQEQRLAGPEGQRLWSFWQQELAGEIPDLELPIDRLRPKTQTFRGASAPLQLSWEASARLAEFGRRCGATPFMTLLASFQALLFRCTGQTDFCVGSPTSGRTAHGVEGLIGYLVNPVALRADLTGDPGLAELLRRVRTRTLAAFDHQDCPFPLLAQSLQPDRNPSRSPIFQVMLALQKGHLGGQEGLEAFALGEPGVRLRLGDLALEPVRVESGSAAFDLVLTAARLGDRFVASLQYNTDLFDRTTALRLLDHFRLFLEFVPGNPESPIASLPLVTEAERHQLLWEWNDTRTSMDEDMLLHEQLEQQVQRTPDAVAVIARDGHCTYAELNRRANRVAHCLRGLGVGSDVPVALYMERTLEMMAALVGVMKAGGAYLGLSLSWPQERLRFVLEDSRAPVVLTLERLLPALPETGALRLCLDRDWLLFASYSEENPPRRTEPENLHSVVYTSGSTGAPKGTLTTIRGYLNLCAWYAAFSQHSAETRSLLGTGLDFDSAFRCVFSPLQYGGCSILADDGPYDAACLLETIRSQRVTLFCCPPSMMHPLLDLAAEDNFAALTSLRFLHLGGEPMVNAKLRRWLRSANCRCTVTNIYGLTETSDVSTGEVPQREDFERLETLPVGRPLRNHRIYILSPTGQPQPIGVLGEVCIGGSSARGFLNRPDLTAQRFAPDPFVFGESVYQTGDLARWLPDGRLDFAGRFDHQVKIRGLRIELGEVETCLNQLQGVRQAVVLPREAPSGESCLVAYLVLDQRNRTGGFDPEGLRRAAAERLPESWIPLLFVPLESMPLTPSGKLDRNSLPAPSWDGLRHEDSFMPPRNGVELAVAEIWSEVLNIKEIGARDNFFQLGGHSLLVTQVVSRIRQVFQVEFPLQDFFADPSIAGIAAHLEKLDRSSVGLVPTPIRRISQDLGNH